MSQASSASSFLWWILFLTSVVLILHEMYRWLKKKTIDQVVIADLPRVEPPTEEVTALATELEMLSKDRNTRLIISRKISDAVIDRVSLTLKIDKDQVSRLSQDQEFLRKNFGEHSVIPSYFSENWIVGLFSSGTQRKAIRKSGLGSACLKEVGVLIEQLTRWEKQHESSRGV